MTSKRTSTTIHINKGFWLKTFIHFAFPIHIKMLWFDPNFIATANKQHDNKILICVGEFLIAAPLIMIRKEILFAQHCFCDSGFFEFTCTSLPSSFNQQFSTDLKWKKCTEGNSHTENYDFQSFSQFAPFNV